MNPSHSLYSAFIGHAARLARASILGNCRRFVTCLIVLTVSGGAFSFVAAQDEDDCNQAKCVIPILSGSSQSLGGSGCSNLPDGASDIVVGPEEDVVDGPVDVLYPGVDTSTDDWYVDNPMLFACPSIGGGAPPRNDPTIAGVPDPAAVNAQVEKLAAQLPGFLHFSGPFPQMVPDNYVYPEDMLKKTSCEDKSNPEGFFSNHYRFCTALDSSPFHGKDIIYVHGFVLGVIAGVLEGHGYPTWPDDPADFAPGGYWRNAAEFCYWDEQSLTICGPPGSSSGLRSHIANFLRHRNGIPRNAKNRYIIVGWSTAQGLETDANAVLNQIAKAMVSGDGVKLVDPADPRGVVGFCVAGCIVISHSTGAPLTDIAMSFAADPVYRQQQGTGPIGFIPKHVKVHAALAGAISGSQLATSAMVLAFGLTNDPVICGVAGMLLLQHTGICDSYYLLQDSVLWDLVPQVMQVNWSSRINDTPVPVLTLAGAGDHRLWPLKFYFQRGFDDGVVTMDSACGRTVPIWEWPSGFYSIPLGFNLADPRLYDRGMRFSLSFPPDPVLPQVEYFLEQNYEYIFSFPPFDLTPRAAGGCAPSKAPWGMIEPIFPYVSSTLFFNPRSYYHNHYSFVQTSEGHGDIFERTDAARWDTRAVLDKSIYTTNPGGNAPETRP